MLKSILFGLFSIALFSIVAVGSLFLTGCGGTDQITVELDMPAEQCIAGHHEACWCESGATGYQVCREDGMAYGHCQCPEVTTDAGTVPEASAEDSATKPDAEANADAQITPDAETDAGVDATEPMLLSYSFIGPMEMQYIEPGADNRILLEFEMRAYASLEIRRMPVYFRTANGAKLFNSGTTYLQNLRVVEVTNGNTLMGPRELPSMIGPNGENSACVNDCVVEFNDAFVMWNGETRRIAIIVDFADYEVDPGDLYGGSFTAELEYNQGDVYHHGTEIEVPLAQINHPDTMVGAWTNVNEPIQPASQLLIQLSPATPQSTILNAGVGADKLFSIYSLSNGTNHPVTFDRVGVQEICTGGFSCKKNVSCLVAEVKGFKMSTSVLDPIGATQIPPLVSGESVTLQPGESADVRISACLQGLMPQSIQGSDLPRSGDSLYLQLFSVFHGDELIAFTEGNIGLPNKMVVRKSKPVITPQQLPTSVITAGERLLASWQAGANNAGSIAIKQFPFRTECTDGMFLGNFRLYRGSVPMSLNAYSIVDMSTGADLKTTTVGGSQGTYPTVAFVGEEFVSNNGNVYSLRATLSFNGSGHHVTTKFINPGSGNITGGLVNNVGLIPPEVAGPDLWHVQEPGGGYGVGTFLWSDLSEVPHSTSSYDWTTGHLVENLDHVWILTN